MLMIELPKVILASASPRRAEILRTIGWPFEVLPVDIDESTRTGEGAVDYVRRLAQEKADAAAARQPASIIVAADTTVTIDGQIMGKPADELEAMRMLRLLNNRWHQVMTGIAVINPESSRAVVAHEETEVRFAAMSAGEIAWYARTLEPMDKAGAYAIQGLGARFIEEIRGDYFNVVGLPIRLVYQVFRESLIEEGITSQ
jgi:septum formation protein